MDKNQLRIMVVAVCGFSKLKGTDILCTTDRPTLRVLSCTDFTLKNIYKQRQKAHEKIIAKPRCNGCTRWWYSVGG